MNSKISDKSVQNLVKAVPDLEHIKLHGCCELSDAAVICISETFHNLQSLDLGWWKEITSNGKSKIGKNCHLLRKLNLSCCHISNSCVISIAKGCPLMQELNLSDCEDLLGSCIIRVSEMSPQLQILSLLQCHKITNGSLMRIGRSSSLLLQLFVGDASVISRAIGVTSLGLVSIVEGCPILEVLHIYQCLYMTDKTLIKIGKGLPN